MEEQIKAVYNKAWKLYKDYLSDKDMGKYNAGKDALIQEYPTTFCRDIVLAWCPVINKIHNG